VALKWTVVARGAALAAGTLVSPVFGAEAVLGCTNVVSGTAWEIKINFEKSTVDSNPARITNTEIAWHDATGGGNYTLDRKTGQLTAIFASSTGGYFIHHLCRPRN
jgi:hypothetical protein